jgi:acetyl esterase/lipase
VQCPLVGTLGEGRSPRRAPERGLREGHRVRQPRRPAPAAQPGPPQERRRPVPAVLCIHGGGFRAGKRDSYDALCVHLAQQGYVALTVSYRLAPKYRFPAAVHDVKAAVRWVRANAAKYHIDPPQSVAAPDTAPGGWA